MMKLILLLLVNIVYINSFLICNNIKKINTKKTKITNNYYKKIYKLNITDTNFSKSGLCPWEVIQK